MLYGVGSKALDGHKERDGNEAEKGRRPAVSASIVFLNALPREMSRVEGLLVLHGMREVTWETVVTRESKAIEGQESRERESSGWRMGEGRAACERDGWQREHQWRKKGAKIHRARELDNLKSLDERVNEWLQRQGRQREGGEGELTAHPCGPSLPAAPIAALRRQSTRSISPGLSPRAGGQREVGECGSRGLAFGCGAATGGGGGSEGVAETQQRCAARTAAILPGPQNPAPPDPAAAAARPFAPCSQLVDGRGGLLALLTLFGGRGGNASKAASARGSLRWSTAFDCSRPKGA